VTPRARTRATALAAAALALVAVWAVRAAVAPGAERAPAPSAGAAAEDRPEPPGRPGAGVELHALPPDELAATRQPAAAAPEETALPPADGAGVSGRVVDAATGRGIGGVLVGDRLQLNRRAIDPSWSDGVTRTDAAGRFAFASLAESVERLVAVHEDYAPAAAERPAGGWHGAREVVISIERGPRVFGTARDDRGEPVAGVHVRVFGPDWPRGVATTTARDGSYRTPAVRPGPIDVVATPPAGASEAESGFTTEWRTADIGTEDLRIDLGPGPQHATWRGRVLDEGDVPLDSGRLVLIALGPGRADPRREERRTADLRQGAFELKKLRPGALYDVTMKLDGEAEPIDLGTVTLETPGITERDLRLAVRTLAGIVVDRDTGGPPRFRGLVSARLFEAGPELRHAKLDEDGRFRFRGLPAGLYDVHVHAPGYAPALRQGVRVGGDALPALRIEVERGAELVVRLRGFEPHVACGLEFEPDGDGPVRHAPVVRTDESGLFEGSWMLPPGVWTVRVTGPEKERAERVVALAPDVPSEVRFLPADLVGFEGRVAVEGSLRCADGAPVAGARLFLAALDAELPDDDDRVRPATTAADGSFRAVGFVPGRWQVSAVLADGGEVDFEDLVVPAAPPDPVPLELVLPEGRVAGRLVDGTDGAPLAADGPRWWAFLRTPDGGRVAAELNGGHTGSSFELRGVPAGRYELLLQARGYFDLVTPPFELGEGERRELGEIRLEPSAVLTVEATTADGRPLDAFLVFVQGTRLISWQSYDRTLGRASWDGLPGGPTHVKVSAQGYLPADRVVDLRVGEVVRATFVLESE